MAVCNFDAIPPETKASRSWTMWKRETRDGQPAKVPYHPDGKRAKSNDPSTWSAFGTVLMAYQDLGGFDGICWMMPTEPKGIIFIDIDHCIKDGIIEPWAQETIERFDSYTEISQSGKGLHILIKGRKPIRRCRKNGSPYEIYDCLRPCYVTGDVVETHTTIEPRQEALDWLFEKIFSSELKQARQDPAPKPSPAHCSMSDDTLILKATLAKGGNEFKALFNGSTLGYKGDDSAADMALMNRLAFWTGGDALQMERIFSASGLGRRNKWQNRPDYRERTIEKAIADAREFYEPRKDNSNGSGQKAEEQLGVEISECHPCDVHELITTFKKWLYIKEDYNITAPFSGIIANFCEGSPDIIGIIGPSGSTKTEFIRSLGETQNEYVYPVSTITEHTLVSGHKDSKDLIPQLKGRILAIKDLTSILSRKEDVRAAIFADFRELTDEYIRKEFGNGIAKEYRDIHSSILFASTNAIERYYSMYSNLGQRMIFIRPDNDPKEARKRASENRGKQKEMRAELHAVAKRFIASKLRAKAEKGLPTTPDDIQEDMGVLYDFLAIARTTIHHDFKTGEIDELPEPEFPTRIANTIGRLLEVHALFYDRDEVNNEDMAFGCRIISDNIPSMRWKVLRSLTKEWQHTSKIAQVADLPPRAAKYHLDELVALKLAEKLLKDEVESSMDRRFDYYKLSDLASNAIEKYDTRIRTEGIIQEQQSKLIDIHNISLPNPCVVFPCVDGAGEQVKEGEDEKSSMPSMGHHPRKDEPTPETGLCCAKCGADLAGCSTVEKGGKLFCASPGCGYPLRGETGP